MTSPLSQRHQLFRKLLESPQPVELRFALNELFVDCDISNWCQSVGATFYLLDEMSCFQTTEYLHVKSYFGPMEGLLRKTKKRTRVWLMFSLKEEEDAHL